MAIENQETCTGAEASSLLFHSNLQTVAFLAAAFLASFVPVFVLAGTGVWPPTAMVQETFTTNFMALDVAKQAIFQIFLPVGHAQIVLLSYPVSWVIDTFFGRWSLFDRFWLFGFLWHIWSGALLFGTLAFTLKTGLRWFERSLLLLVPLASPFLIRSYNLGVWIGYDRAEALAVLALAIPFMLWIGHERAVRFREAVFCGVVIAFATGTKITFGGILLPFIAVMFLMAPPRHWWFLVPGFCAGFATSMWAIVEIFFLGNIDQMSNFARRYALFLSGDALAQGDPAIVDSFVHFLSPASWYFSLQAAMVVVAACLAALATLRPGFRRSAFAVAAIAAAVGEVLVLRERLALSAMADIASLIIFVGVVVIGALSFSARRLWAVCGSVALTAAVLTAPFLYNFSHGFAVMAANSATARRFEEAVSQPHLPVIYYQNGVDQRLIFPDPGTMLSTLLPEGPPGYRRPILVEFMPNRLFNHPPSAGLDPGTQIAVVPELLKTNQESPEQVAVFGHYAAFDAMLANDSCQHFDFGEPQPSRYAIHYYYYPNRVTVCAVPASIPPSP